MQMSVDQRLGPPPKTAYRDPVDMTLLAYIYVQPNIKVTGPIVK
jgi:hypothetical protein